MYQNEKWTVLCECDTSPKEKVLCPDHAAVCEIADMGTDVVWAEYITCDVDEPCWVCGE